MDWGTIMLPAQLLSLLCYSISSVLCCADTKEFSSLLVCGCLRSGKKKPFCSQKMKIAVGYKQWKEMPSGENVCPYTWFLVLLHLRACWILDTADPGYHRSITEPSWKSIHTFAGVWCPGACDLHGVPTQMGCPHTWVPHLLGHRSGYGVPGMAVRAQEAQVIQG